MTDPATPAIELDSPEFRLGEGRISGVLSVFLGSLSLLGVLCFRYPDVFSVPDVRARFDIPLLRNVLFVSLVLSCLMAGISFVLNKRGRLWIVGLGTTIAAVALGGNEAARQTDARLALPIGLDWFVVDLLLTAVLFVPMERIWAQRKQRIFRPQWSTDLSYFAMTHLFIQLLILLTTLFATRHLTGWIIQPTQDLFTSWSPWIQFPVAVFVADVLQLLVHRSYHKIPWLWRFHAVHHSAEHMDWLAGSRLHLGEVLVTRTVVFLPLFILGFEPVVLYAYIGFVGMQATWVHCNLNWKVGFLDRVLVTPRYHHWHHAKDAAYTDKNYAVHLPLVDMLFGTYKLPKSGWPAAYGTLGEPLPRGIWRQHVYPFRGQLRK